MSKPIVVFDMDGVLAEVTESYRETVVRTVERFTGVEIDRDYLQEFKNRGGWNNDWMLSHRLVLDQGVDVPYETVVREFKKLFFGEDDSEGLVMREKWIARPGVLERLGQRFQLALFTGRDREELKPTIERFAQGVFDPIVTAENVVNPKPAPDGLLHIRELNPGRRVRAYIGDTVDDARAARAAGVPFIGIASPGNPRRKELVALFECENAVAVLDDINQLEAALPE